MKRFFQTAFALCLAASGSTLLTGCGFLTAPEPDPIPEEVPIPAPDIFVPTDFNNDGIELNKAGDPTLPEYFEVTRIDSGELLWPRSVDTRQVGNPPREQITYGAPDAVRLAGIVVPQPGQPGAQESINTLRRWTLGRKLNIQQDGKYPVDSQGIRRVQIFFPGGKDGAQQLNLNRMMVRSGFAVVDVFAPTMFDTKGWLNDEEYARTNRLGLWKLGIVMNQRQPPPVKTTTKVTVRTNADVRTSMPPSAMPGAPTMSPGLPSTPASTPATRP